MPLLFSQDELYFAQHKGGKSYDHLYTVSDHGSSPGQCVCADRSGIYHGIRYYQTDQFCPRRFYYGGRIYALFCHTGHDENGTAGLDGGYTGSYCLCLCGYAGGASGIPSRP